VARRPHRRHCDSALIGPLAGVGRRRKQDGVSVELAGLSLGARPATDLRDHVAAPFLALRKLADQQGSLPVLSNNSSEGVAAGHSAAPRRLQEMGVSTR
jgi:hypothetical protein